MSIDVNESTRHDEPTGPSDPTARRSRRAILTAGLGALGATVASAVVGTEPAAAASYVKLGDSSSTNRTTMVTNTSSSRSAIGIRGRVTHTTGSSGSAGVRGEDLGTDGVGVLGKAAEGANARGVYGLATEGIGVLGVGGTFGVRANATATDATGVYATAPSVAIQGGDEAQSATYGVVAHGSYVGAFGIGTQFGVAGQAPLAGYAVFATGRAHVAGTLTKLAGSFRIDHPLDPDHRWLSHSFVESPDMMNIYNGNVTTDARGRATIRMPRWFMALNKEFRYQLTVIGTFAQAIVDQEMTDKGRFRIRTNEPRTRVSWQVTGIRRDAYANAHRIRVQTAKKGAERGTREFVPRGSGAKRTRHVVRPGGAR